MSKRVPRFHADDDEFDYNEHQHNKHQQDRRRDKIIKNALRSKNLSALVDPDDEY